jgi:hypothetical protein
MDAVLRVRVSEHARQTPNIFSIWASVSDNSVSRRTCSRMSSTQRIMPSSKLCAVSATGMALVSLLKGETNYGKMTIGSVARCVCCGGEQKDHRSIRCAECGSMFVCKGCGKTVHGYGRYIDNHFYCKECSYRCTACGEEFIGMPRIGIARSGERRGICPACYAQVVDVCRNCTIHSDCLSIGANRFCPNQMNDLTA